MVKFPTWRNTHNDIEDRIYGEGGEVPMSDKYMCEECGDIYFSLVELGFCVNTAFSMKELLEEYHRDYVKEVRQ